MKPEKLAHVSIEDAQGALERRHKLQAAGHDPGPDAILVVGALLDKLLVMAEPDMVIPTDGDGYIVEGALQNGFDMIDDNGNLLVVHGNDLIKWVKMTMQHQAEANDLAVRRYNLVRQHARGMFIGLEAHTPEDFDALVDSFDTVELPPHAQVPE